jgi:peptidoglycan/LPS O-acetylase OafA/YrhL
LTIFFTGLTQKMSHVSENKIQYFSSIEWLRFFAAFGIVWFHTEGASWRMVGYSGLPVFLLVFCALIVVHYSEITFKEFIYRRSVRLLIPWLFWSLIYGLTKVFKHFFVSKEAFGSMEFNWILIGGSIHLWYLLFAFLASVFLYYVCRYTLKRETGPGFIAGIIGIGILTLYFSSFAMEKLSIGEPFSQWLFALPALPTGFCLGVVLRSESGKSRMIWLLGILAVLLLAFSGLLLLGQHALVVPYAIGLFLTILALQLHLPFESTAVQLGKLTYGIYLIHPLVSAVTGRVFPVSEPLIKIIGVFVMSALIVYLLKRTVFRFVL